MLLGLMMDKPKRENDTFGFGHLATLLLVRLAASRT